MGEHNLAGTRAAPYSFKDLTILNNVSGAGSQTQQDIDHLWLQMVFAVWPNQQALQRPYLELTQSKARSQTPLQCRLLNAVGLISIAAKLARNMTKLGNIMHGIGLPPHIPGIEICIWAPNGHQMGTRDDFGSFGEGRIRPN